MAKKKQDPRWTRRIEYDYRGYRIKAERIPRYSSVHPRTIVAIEGRWDVYEFPRTPNTPDEIFICGNKSTYATKAGGGGGEVKMGEICAKAEVWIDDYITRQKEILFRACENIEKERAKALTKKRLSVINTLSPKG